jgi:hypothetical protein
VEKGLSKKEIRLYHHLQGLIEIEKKNNAQAIEYLGKAVSSLPAQSSASTWSFAGRTSMGGSMRPVGRTICSTTWPAALPISWRAGVAEM